MQGVLDIISNYYKKTALLKSGAKELLEKLDKHNIPMTVASSNNKKEIEMAFERLGIAKYFDRIFTCEEVGAGKTKPDIYLRAAEYSNLSGGDGCIRRCHSCNPYCKAGRVPGCRNL